MWQGKFNFAKFHCRKHNLGPCFVPRWTSSGSIETSVHLSGLYTCCHNLRLSRQKLVGRWSDSWRCTCILPVLCRRQIWRLWGCSLHWTFCMRRWVLVSLLIHTDINFCSIKNKKYQCIKNVCAFEIILWSIFVYYKNRNQCYIPFHTTIETLFITSMPVWSVQKTVF